MVARRPLVQVEGRTRQLPGGDSLLGVPVYLAVSTQALGMLKVTINSSTLTVAATRQGGAVLTIAVTLNG